MRSAEKKKRDRGMKEGAEIDYQHMEEKEAGTDVHHVISFDRPAHPACFWL